MDVAGLRIRYKCAAQADARLITSIQKFNIATVFLNKNNNEKELLLR